MPEVGGGPRRHRTLDAGGTSSLVVAGARAGVGDDRSCTGGGAVRFGTRVVLTKEEAFGACQALADAGRVLVRTGRPVEADSLCSLFVLIEDRLVVG